MVALQELKATDAAFPAAALEEAGYGALWQGEARWNGVALLARGPRRSRAAADCRASRTPRAATWRRRRGVIVGALYLPNGNPQPGPRFDYKLRWMERLIRHARSLVELPHPALLLGDFNVIPTEADVYDPKAWRRDALFQPEVREARLLAQGWTDAVRKVHGDATIYTFWDYFRQHAERDRGLRIDHLLLNPVLASRLKGAGVDRWTPTGKGQRPRAGVGDGKRVINARLGPRVARGVPVRGCDTGGCPLSGWCRPPARRAC